MSNGIYHTIRWKYLRRKIFNRDRWRCVLCGRAGRLECHHKTPLAAGGDPFEESNLETLCRSCHIAETARQNTKPVHPDVQEWRAKVRELVT